METVKFDELQLDERIIRAITEMGFEEASPIQAQAIPVAMELSLIHICARRAQELIRRERLEGLLGKQAVEDVLLAHELFHVTEYRKKAVSYTHLWMCG